MLFMKHNFTQRKTYNHALLPNIKMDLNVFSFDLSEKSSAEVRNVQL